MLSWDAETSSESGLFSWIELAFELEVLVLELVLEFELVLELGLELGVEGGFVWIPWLSE